MMDLEEAIIEERIEIIKRMLRVSDLLEPKETQKLMWKYIECVWPNLSKAEAIEIASGVVN